MPTDKQRLKVMIKEQIENEKKAVKLLKNSMKKTSNTVIQLMFLQLVLDSTRHENMLRTVLRLLKASPKEQFLCESDEFRKILEQHVEVESKMLKDFERIVDETSDSRIKFILQDLISDEKKHHAIIKRVYELVCEGEKIRDEKWWDFLFRYSRLTG